MFEKIIRMFTGSRTIAPGGLVSLPVAIAVDVDAALPEVPVVALEEWLRLPAEQQAPAAAVAAWSASDEGLSVLIVDVAEQTSHSIVVGPISALDSFTAAFAVGPGGLLGDDVRAIFNAGIGHDRDIKTPGTGPGGGPRVPDPTTLVRAVLLGQVASVPAVIARRRRDG